MKKKYITILLVVAFLAGLSLLLYPAVSDWWNSLHQTYAVASYVEKTSDFSEEQNEQIREAAEAYNEKLFQEGSLPHDLTEEEQKEYDSLLNVTGDGMMGYVTIPKIQVEVPIYHGTDDAVLEIAVGHLPGTSLPVGGLSTHTVISGHRGLPSARLFTDIDQLQEGDTFSLNVLDQTLSYEVDQIRTVLPDELQDLAIQENEDYCTLVTCTPYGVNTHRLLVRGHRIPNAADDVHIVADAVRISPLLTAPVISAVILLILMLWVFLAGRAKRKRPGSGPHISGNHDHNEEDR
ncbi:MAG: class C sortase [Bilifractor sp.]